MDSKLNRIVSSAFFYALFIFMYDNVLCTPTVNFLKSKKLEGKWFCSLANL